MTNDYYDPHRQPDKLENYGVPSDPNERKRFEQEKMAEFRNRQGQGQATPPPAQAPPAAIPPQERVFLVNNMARPIHVPQEGINIDGQLAVSPSGPFKQMSRQELNDAYQLQEYMKRPVSTRKGHPKYGKKQVEEISESEFRKQYAEYRNKKTIREAEYAKNQSTVNHMGDGSVDEFDAAQEVVKIRPSILRAQG